MTLSEFNALPYERQLVAVFDTADYVATRYERSSQKTENIAR